jgi:iron complex outermembrane recepter protein
VIRGPGGTLWGANAVNGVINIITKQAKDMQGTLVTAGGGTEERAFGGVSHGVQLGEDSYLRVFAEGWRRDAGFLETGEPDDEARLSRGGFHYDTQLSADDSFTLQGDFYDGRQGTADENITADSKTSGGNLLGRWTRALPDGGQTSLQLYYDMTELDNPVLEESRDTFDLEFQHDLPAWGMHHFIYGITYRYTTDEIGNTPQLSLIPDHRTDELTGAFLQDEIELSPEKLYLTLGSKFEDNDYTGSEVQPNIRLSWYASETSTVWAAVSKAVRTPSRLESDLRLEDIPGFGDFMGNPMLEAEELIAYETGFRFSPTANTFVDIALFHNKYDKLVTTEFEPGVITFANKSGGNTQGVEIATTYTLTSDCKLTAGYSYLEMDLELDDDSTSLPTAAATIEGSNPEQQAFVRMGTNFSRRYELDFTVRYVDELPAQSVESYTVADLRFAAHISDNLELSLVGQNLFEKHHFEQGTTTATEVEDGAYAKMQWRF